MTKSRSRLEYQALAAAAMFAVMSAASPTVSAQTKVTDKWITIVLGAEPPHLEGCYSSSAHQGRFVKQNVVETLIEKNPKDGVLKPRLATAWEQISPDTWQFKLRQGVTFHDGAPFDADAVKKSLDRNWNKALVCADRTKFFGEITIEVTPVDGYTVQIKTSRPEPTLPMRLASTAIVGPNSAVDKPSIAPVGTGPYVFDSWQSGQQVLLRRNEKYWGAKPEVEGARYIWRDVSSVRASMVKIGEADIAHAIAPQEANDPKMDHSFLNSETAFLRFDTEKAPLNDKRIRMAVNYALDRASLPGTILPKTAILATQMVFPAVPGHNHELDKRSIPYDPAKAKQLIAEAKAGGVPVDTQIQLVYYSTVFPNANELMEALNNMLQTVGLNTKLAPMESAQYKTYQNKPFPQNRQPVLLLEQHDNNFGDPVFSVYPKYGCDASTSAICDPAFDKEVLRVSALSGQERLAGWQEVFRVLYDDIVPTAFLYHMVGFVRVGPRIDYVPDVTSNAEIRIQEIHFKR